MGKIRRIIEDHIGCCYDCRKLIKNVEEIEKKNEREVERIRVKMRWEKEPSVERFVKVLRHIKSLMKSYAEDSTEWYTIRNEIIIEVYEYSWRTEEWEMKKDEI